jgi:DNA-binding PadR family transcriptional regulator
MRRDPADLLPLSAVAFEILLMLTDGEQHGYHIMQAVEARTGGAMTMHPGTLYRALARLLEQELIEELPATQTRAAGTDDRRRPFRLTVFGRAVAEAEAERLEGQVRRARRGRLLGQTGRRT